MDHVNDTSQWTKDLRKIVIKLKNSNTSIPETAVTQKLFNTRQKDAAKSILVGKWSKSHLPAHSSVPGLEKFWVELMGRSGPQTTVS